MAIAVEALSRTQDVKAANVGARFPRFRTARPITVGEDGSLHRGKRSISLGRDSVGEVINNLLDTNVAGVEMAGGVVWVNGNLSEAPAGKITVHQMDRTTHDVPFNPKKDFVVFPTVRQLPSAVRERISY